MRRSLTATVPTQRDAATAPAPDAASRFKQLTLWLGSSPRQVPHRSRMANATYQAPIARLPVELLSYIFILGAHTPDLEDAEMEEDVPEGPEGGDGSAHDDGRADISPCMSSSSTRPDVFAAVCRHWRAVALSTPQLWTRICVTIGDLMESSEGRWFPSVARYVSRSGRCPLDVYIDARDPDWDFSENDTIGAIVNPYVEETFDYAHPFRVEHMHYVLSLLLPHVARMRSLAVLTDRWAPMEAALECLSFENPTVVASPRPLPRSLPLLESLVLMRCNEFVSYHPQFSPRERRDPRHLPFSGLLKFSAPEHPSTAAQSPLLPRLRQLSLSGVHLNWASLPSLLPSSPSPGRPGLERLELSYHSQDVRPTEQEFREIIAACGSLKSLTIRASGIRSSTTSLPCNAEGRVPSIALPNLTTLEFGYDDVPGATTLLGFLDLTAVKHVVFEDASSPGRDETLDAEALLWACATSSSDAGSDFEQQPLFPGALSVTLRRVEASAEAFEAFYAALPNLQKLTVAQMFLLGSEALTRRNVDLIFIPPEMPTYVPACGPLPVEDEQRRAKSMSSQSSCGILNHTVLASPGTARGSERGVPVLW